MQRNGVHHWNVHENTHTHSNTYVYIKWHLWIDKTAQPKKKKHNNKFQTIIIVERNMYSFMCWKCAEKRNEWYNLTRLWKNTTTIIITKLTNFRRNIEQFANACLGAKTIKSEIEMVANDVKHQNSEWMAKTSKNWCHGQYVNKHARLSLSHFKFCEWRKNATDKNYAEKKHHNKANAKIRETDWINTE